MNFIFISILTIFVTNIEKSYCSFLNATQLKFKRSTSASLTDQCQYNSTLDIRKAEKLYAANNCKDCLSYRFEYLPKIKSGSSPFVGGTETNGEPLHICRLLHDGSLIVGKADFKRGICYIAVGRVEKTYQMPGITEIFTNPKNATFKWVRGGGSKVLENAVVGGQTAKGEKLYIGRGTIDFPWGSTLAPGKIFQNSPNIVYLTWFRKVYLRDIFEILVCT